ncbi:MAG TPA: hypothetical protein VMH86_09275 [Rhizomicrobium sp.]|nr:hypothetical protein [Rhizomicrobium sp.]
MKIMVAACVAALMLAGGAAADPNSDGTNADGPAWLGGIAGQKLIAVDGSSITLSPSDDKLTVTQVSSGGAGRTRSFTLVNGNMGTVADDAGNVIGFFRVTGTGLDAQFSDNHTEQLTLNGGGGISLALKGSAGDSCMAWYPAGHAFSEAERRAAVADYASRLGLQTKDKAPRLDSCAATGAAAPPQPVSRGRHLASAHAAAKADGAGPILVRNSVPHAIDPPDIPMAPYAGAQPAAMPAPAQVAAMPAAPQVVAPAAPQVVAPAAPMPAKWTPAAQAAELAPPEPGHGASDCLEVDSDGANLGFRNSCGYEVRVAYCLQMQSPSPARCGAGTETGDVPAKGFAPVVFDSNIRAEDAEHDFRWVACSGSAADVTPYLDRADPPAGRCVKVKSS